MRILRRKASGIVVALAACAMFGVSSAGAKDPLVIVSWGGSWGDAVKHAYTDPFEKEFGEKFVFVNYNGGIAELRAQVRSGNPTWDIMDMNGPDITLACEDGLLEEVNPSQIPAAADGTPGDKDWLPGGVQPCGVGNIIQANIMAYSKATFPKDAPKSVADFWDLKKFPGKRAMLKSPRTNLEWALIADGVPREKVYEVLATEDGVDRAFRKMSEIKDEVIWWEAGAQPPQILADGEAAIVTAYNGRIHHAAANEGQPFKVMWDTQIWDFGAMGVVKGAPHKERAMAFLLKGLATPEYQARVTSYISYGPMRLSAASMVDPKSQG